MTEKDKLARRLSQILLKLNSGEKLRIDELAKEFNVNKRTIQRDLNVRFDHLPLKKDDGSYSLDPYHLGKLTMSDIQNFAAISGVKGLFPSLENGFLKRILEDVVNNAVISVRCHHYENVDDKKELFSKLQKAIADKNIVEFVYSDKKRSVCSYKLVNNKGVWYLSATDESKLKSFSLTKMKNVAVTDKIFEHDPSVLRQIESDDGIWYGETICITMEVSPSIAQYFRRRALVPNQQIVEELPSGALIVSSTTSMPDHVCAVARYWIPNLKIISPASLQQELENGLREYLHVLNHSSTSTA